MQMSQKKKYFRITSAIFLPEHTTPCRKILSDLQTSWVIPVLKPQEYTLLKLVMSAADKYSNWDFYIAKKPHNPYYVVY